MPNLDSRFDKTNPTLHLLGAALRAAIAEDHCNSAIKQSIKEDRIVHLSYTHALASALEYAANDSVDNGGVTEYRGEFMGREWRIDLDRR